jgi:hypothetical protein
MIARSARMIFSAYRRDDFADAESFVLQLGVILERYSDGVIGTVSHPLTGIARRCKFPPSIAEVVEACDDAAASEARLAGGRLNFPRRPLVKRHRANVLVHRGAPQYDAMLERSKTAGADLQDWRQDDEGRGLWVNVAWLWDMDDRRGAKPVGRVAAQVARR